ncbi:Putative fatty acyl-CoA reductase [Frankliniella fusca]|uniref:Fatty acyl-CoA reductase n=1 Tax=Frankliniella fusca TaxID=407009 RepID=A0AAE1LNR1_9NEOP|nr:Putative fatty acyl-CoA reductase [Frankliniella fusca]
MDISEFYRGRNVLVTGVTGFVGKAIVEKLLRCCPDVGCIYVLVRSKRGIDPMDRITKVLRMSVFADLPVEKVTPVVGDVTLPNLGLSIEDYDAVVSNVSVVLHSAATVSFVEPLRLAVLLNVQAIQHILQLSRSIKNLASVVHVSTAYSNCDRRDIGEEIYAAPVGVKEMLRRAQEEGDLLDNEASRLIGKRPNTYTFTKALAENLWAEDARDLPVAIVRPSIIGWAWRDPIPGWVDNANSIVGPFTAIASGTMRSVHCDPAKVCDLIPVDIVVNTVLAAACRTARERPPLPGIQEEPGRAAQRASATPTVYNCVSGASNPVTWGKLLHEYLVAVRANPSPRALWWPDCTFTPSWLYHNIRVATLMILPAFLFDLIAPLLGRSTSLLKTQRRSKNLITTLSPFCTNDWNFSDGNMRRLWSDLSARDRILFPLDVTAIDWVAYMRTAAVGYKRFLMKEEVNTGPRNV